jgi:chemosensory pili system protein ChpA (sensor histidine kinase/response regulator)
VDSTQASVELDAPASFGADLKAPVVATLPVAPLAAPVAAAAPAAMETEGARAQLRVRADLIDRLVNEAGEVAIARARVEGEMRSLKSNLLELTGSVIRLRSQVREIEIRPIRRFNRACRWRTRPQKDSIRSNSTGLRGFRN